MVVPMLKFHELAIPISSIERREARAKEVA
jgi:hypothetical protein